MHQNYTKYNTETPPKYHQTFTGKERDSETGFSYFGARYYDSDLMTGWLSVDPMADKYPSLSPYAYCAWNPVKLVDPDGRDVWEVDTKGNITCKEKSNKHYLYSINEQGKRSNFVELSDEKILQQLSKYETANEYDAFGSVIRTAKLRTATSKNKDDIAKLFHFLASNTNVEWSLFSFEKNNVSEYGIGTFQFNNLAPGPYYLKKMSDFTVKSMIHSHPKPSTNLEEMNSMYGDKSVSTGCSFNYYVYMTKSTNLYKVKGNKIVDCGKQVNYKSLMKYF